MSMLSKIILFALLNFIIHLFMKEFIHVLPYKIMPSHSCYQVPLQRYKTLSETYQKRPESTVIYNLSNIQFLVSGQPCNHTNPEQYLTVCIVSRTTSYKRREVIRKTWASNALNGRVNFIFFVGLERGNFRTSSQLRFESKRYKDIVVVDYADTYKNLTFKSVSALKWCLEFCPNSKYFLKIDEDVYVDIPRVLNLLNSVHIPKVILGYLLTAGTPVRDNSSKSYVSKRDYAHDTFPVYVTGASYAISMDLLPGLLHAAGRLPSLSQEDVFVTGLCGAQAGATLLGNCGFGYIQRSVNGWSFQSLINGHKFSEEEMEELWSTQQNLFDSRHNWLRYRQFFIM